MIVMINGPFGVGKTTVAEKLYKKIDNSLIFDPEEVGFMLRNIVTDQIKSESEKTGDFQDIRIWKELVVDVAEKLVKIYHKNLIVPMTICDIERFGYIRQGFESIDKVYHFCLLAKKETIAERLLLRGDTPESWAFMQTEKCLVSFEGYPDIFDKIIYTDNVSITEILYTIEKMVG